VKLERDYMRILTLKPVSLQGRNRKPRCFLIRKARSGLRCRLTPCDDTFLLKGEYAEAKIMDQEAIGRAILRMAHEILEKNKDVGSLALVGIHTRGLSWPSGLKLPSRTSREWMLLMEFWTSPCT